MHEGKQQGKRIHERMENFIKYKQKNAGGDTDYVTEHSSDVMQPTPAGNQEEFDFLLFFSELNQIMKSHLSFYQIIAQKNAYAYLIKDFSRILEKGLSKHYLKNHSSFENRLKIRYMVNGIMGVYINWLARPENISENELIVILSEMLEHNLSILIDK